MSESRKAAADADAEREKPLKEVAAEKMTRNLATKGVTSSADTLPEGSNPPVSELLAIAKGPAFAGANLADHQMLAVSTPAVGMGPFSSMFRPDEAYNVGRSMVIASLQAGIAALCDKYHFVPKAPDDSAD